MELYLAIKNDVRKGSRRTYFKVFIVVLLACEIVFFSHLNFTIIVWYVYNIFEIRNKKLLKEEKEPKKILY